MITEVTGRTIVPRSVAKQSEKLDLVHKGGFYSKMDRQSLAAKFALHSKYDNDINNLVEGSKRLILSWTFSERRLEKSIVVRPG